MTNSQRAGQLTIILAMVLFLAPQTFGAGALTAKSRQPTDAVSRDKRLHNSDKNGGQSEARPDLVMVQAPQVRPGPLLRRFPLGSRLVRLGSTDVNPHVLTPDFFAVADPRISFDGLRVLFAGRKSADALWQIWEMNVDGSNARQVTHCPTDCLKPAYLPRGRIVYTVFPKGPSPSAAARPVAPSSHLSTMSQASSQIWVSNLDGSAPQQITYGPGDFEVETVMQDGVILATARSPLLPSSGRPADRELYTVRPDGTALATLRCDHQHPAIRSQAAELDDGAVVFVKASLTSRNLGGELAWIRRGAVHNSPLTPPSVRALWPQPLAADQLLVARESTTRPGTGKKLGLFAFDAAAGRFGIPIYEDAKLSTLEAVPVAAHERPRWYWSTLDPELQRGFFICLDSYLAQGYPHGRMATKLARLRVLTLDAATQKDAVLGEAPIEEDGSFYIAVPPDKPLRFEVLDAAGRVVRAQRSWIWARSGEEHGCVGCHEDHAVAPENRWPMTLRRFDTPTRLDLADHPASSH